MQIGESSATLKRAEWKDTDVLAVKDHFWRDTATPFIPYLNSRTMFRIGIKSIFGNDIPGPAIELLRTALLHGTLPEPAYRLIDGQAFEGSYSRGVISLSKELVLEAIGSARSRFRLFLVMIEEFGHHLDHLLRTHYSRVGGRSRNGDRGQIFASDCADYNNIMERDFHYADFSIAERIDGRIPCGGIWLLGGADCRFVPDEECDTRCEPAAMATACAARSYVGCDESCLAPAEAGCTAACEPSCAEECHLWLVHEDPPDSLRLCMSSCEQDCDAACDGAEPGECRSTCSHNCGEKCEQAECRDDDQAAACAPKCTTSCEGACRARASGDCQRSCQSQQFPACKTELVDRCHEACAQAGGAIFCGGQFLDAASVHACADELAEERLAHIDVGAAADGEGASGCSVARGGPGPLGLLVSLGALGLFGVIRPRRR